MMVAQGLRRTDVEDPKREVAFPESVINMLRGDIGQPPGGWPQGIVQKVLKGEPPNLERPGKHLPPVDLEATRAALTRELKGLSDEEDSRSLTIGDDDLN